MPVTSKAWEDVVESWQTQNYPWVSRPATVPDILGGNQQGFVEILDQQVTNDIGLTITNITGNTTTPTVITSPNYNLEEGQVIQISMITPLDPFVSLNGGKFSIIPIDANNFQLWVYNPLTLEFDLPATNPPGVYIGGGRMAVLDNFNVVSKKFNFLEEGQNIQMGYLDILMPNTSNGAISLNVYLNYNDDSPINILPQNIDPSTVQPDTFFNSIIPTSSQGGLVGDKNWQRVICPARGAFITLEYTLSNAQMVGVEQGNDVQIDAQVLWTRKAGRLQSGGI